PREDEFPGTERHEGRASPDQPLPSQSPSRPTWRREPERATRRPGTPPPSARPASRSPFGAPDAQRERHQPPPPQRAERYDDYDERSEYDPHYGEPRRPAPPQRRYEEEFDDGHYAPREQHREPMIGVDIGVPAPARRIRTDPAAQTRSAVVAIVAIGAILGVIFLAFLISNLGDDDPVDPGIGGDDTSTGGEGTVPAATTNEPTSTAEGGIPRGIVPDVVGLDIAVARAQVEAAGYVVNEVPGPSAAPEGEVFGQVPVGNTHHPEGDTVTLAVSEGS
ncbi:MAG: PASTA domain-containing protein, partial [Dehalococcoidia bacterium]|nr:PASTA domain-containing protein [Dehalococcoidia bacterium]